MKNNSQIKVGAILSYITIIANMVIGILYTPILTSTLGQSEYGLYSLVTSVISYLTVLDFGFGNAIIIYTAKYKVSNKEKEQKLHGMFLIIYIIIGIIAGFIGMLLWLNVDKLFGQTMTIEELQKAKVLMGILTLNLILTFPFSIFSSIVTAYEKFIFSKTLNLIRIIINPIVMIILLKYGYKSIALVVLTTILNIATLIINTFYCRKKLRIKLKFGNLDIKMLKEIMAYSIWIFLNSIMDKINWQVDQFVLGIVNGTKVVAVYSIASKLNQMYLGFSTAISGVMLPKMARMEEKKASDKEFSDVFIKTGRIQYIVMGLIISAFLLYGKEFINIMWVGKEYSEAYMIACILMIPLTVPLIQNVGLNILQAKNKYKFRVIVLLIFAIFNLIVTILFAKLWGGIGAAIGTSLSIIIGQIIFMNVFYYKKIHIEIPKFWKNILKMTIPIIITYIIGMLLKNIIPINNKILWCIETCIYVIIYVLIIGKYGINAEEKQLFKRTIGSIVKKTKLL